MKDTFSDIVEQLDGGLEIRDANALSYTYVPNEIKFRDDQIKEIIVGIYPVVRGGYARNIALVGDTGTGKTLTVRYVLKRFKEEYSITSVYFVGEHTARHFLNSIAAELECEVPKGRIANSQVHEAITKHLTEHDEKIVVVFDEVDTYFEERQNDLFMALLKRNEGRISIVIITNAIHKVVMAFIPAFQSIAQLKSIKYPKYTADELQTILEERASLALGEDKLDEPAARLIATWVSSESGDARFALIVLSESVDLARRKGESIVSAETVVEAYQQAETEFLLMPLEKLSDVEKRVYLTILELSGSGANPIPRSKVLVAINVERGAEGAREYGASWLSDKLKRLAAEGHLLFTTQGRAQKRGVDWCVAVPPEVKRDDVKRKLREALGFETGINNERVKKAAVEREAVKDKPNNGISKIISYLERKKIPVTRDSIMAQTFALGVLREDAEKEVDRLEKEGKLK